MKVTDGERLLQVGRAETRASCCRPGDVAQAQVRGTGGERVLLSQ